MSDIEKDIERCKQLTQPEHANWIGISNQLAIAHLIERIKELEEENTQLEAIKDDAIRRYNLESIPVQKVNDEIEKYEYMLAETIHGEIQKYTPGEILLKINTLKEILEDKQ